MGTDERDRNSNRFGLAELIDLEVQLASDRERPVAELIERDRAIALGGTRSLAKRSTVLSNWLSALRANEDEQTTGERTASAHLTLNWLVALIFSLIGVGVALAVLQFTGDHPINVLVVLGVFVGLQSLNIFGTVAAFAWSRFSPEFFGRFPLVALVRRLFARLIGPQDTARIFARRSLYLGVERWVLFKVMQWGALAFNVGVLVTFIAAVTFTDLAFAWSTTLQVGTDALHRFCGCLATPWRAFFADAVPSLELIEATKYFRLDGAYANSSPGVRIETAALAGGWWPFLLMCLLVYGLLPRFVLTVLGSLGLRRALGSLPFDTPDVEEVLLRLTAPQVRNIHQNDPGNVTPLGDGHSPLSKPPTLSPGTKVLAVRWRDTEISDGDLSAQVRTRLGAEVDSPVADAGGHDYANDELLLARFSGTSQPVVLFAEPWTAPDRSFKRLVNEMRQRGEKNRKMVVVLTEGGDGSQRDVWSGYLAELGDPYIALDTSS